MPPIPSILEPASKSNRKPCAECRRSRIKCDRDTPCGNCTKRGIASICPTGSLATSGGKFVLQGTTELHARIHTLTVRIKKLEVALEEAHARTSTIIHPLLCEEERIDIPEAGNIQVDIELLDTEFHEMEMSTSFSMLSIDSDVRASRFTPSIHSLWYLDGQQSQNIHHAPSGFDNPERAKQSSFPVELLRVSQGPAEDGVELLDKLLACLPSADVATVLIDTYYATIGVFSNIVPRDFFSQEYWNYVYTSGERPECSSCLGVLFNVLCLGALWSTELPQGALTHEKYNQLAMLAISTDPVNISMVEALTMQVLYWCTLDPSHSRPWACLGMAIKHAQTLGIDRECSTWKISEEDRQRRRRVFHELHSYDCYMSMLVGRSNYLSKGQYNSPLPQEIGKTSSEMSASSKMQIWKYLFLGQGVRSLLCLVLSTNGAPTYEGTLALDKKLRSYDSVLDPNFLNSLGTTPTLSSNLSPEQKQILLQQQFVCLAKDTTFMHLHRGFLNRAVTKPVDDPISSKWSISVMAAYQSACAIIRQIRLMRDYQPEFLRLLNWTESGLTAVITLGALVIKTPYSSLAPVGYQELQSGCNLLRTALSPDHYLQPILTKLEQAASKAFDTRDHVAARLRKFSPLPEVRRPIDSPSENVNGNGFGFTPNYNGLNSQTENNVVQDPSNLTSSTTSKETPPAPPQEALESLFGTNGQLVDSTLFSTQFPFDPVDGGMNWHFLPAPIEQLPDSWTTFASNPARPNLGPDNPNADVEWMKLLTQLGNAQGAPNDGISI